MKRLIGRTDMEDALKKLDKLTNEEARMAVAQNLKATHNVDERVIGVANTMVAVDNRVAGVDDRVAGVDSKVACVDDKVASVGDTVKIVDGKVAEVIHGAQKYLRSIADAVLKPRTVQMEGRQRLSFNKLPTT